jgi:type I restriction enzyme S subunit
MIDGLKPYSDYQETGAYWLGQVPKHWSVMPNRAIFEEVKDRDHPTEEMLSVTITRGIVRQRALLADTSKKDSSNQNKSAYKLIQPNDIAYNKMRAWQGAIGVSDLRGIISPAYVVMRLRSSQVPRYLHYLYRTPQFAKEAERWSYGITSDMWSLRPEHFKMIYTALPPLDEQAAIVKFLDYANGKIERAIRAKRKLIGLLNEQKQAIIHRAVTRGRDPNVKLKPSGIPWLGDVPEHWDVMRGKYLGRLFSTPSVMDNELTEDSDGNAMYLKVSDLAGADDSFRLTRSRLYAKRSMPRETTRRSMIVFPKRGGAIYTNKVAIVESACLVDPNLMCWAISERFDPHYVALLLKTRTLADLADVSSVPQINNHHINPVPFPAPPVAEQTSIVAGLERDLAGVNSAVSRVDRELELLREYRTTLTAEVVTGKLDVREVAKRLPDQTDEPLPPDESLDEMVDDEII